MPDVSRRPMSVLLAAGCLVLAMSVSVPAHSAGLTYRISPTAGPPGTTITFTGSGCAHTGNGPSGSDGAFAFVVLPTGNFSGQQQAYFHSASDGRFTGRFHVRTGQRPGRYQTGLSCYGDGGAGWPNPTNPHFRVSPVGIESVVSDPVGPDTGSPRSLRAERLVVVNMTSTAVNLKGWTVRNRAGAGYTFPATTLRPGDPITVHTGAGRNTRTDLYWGRHSYAWDNTSDTATLRNAGGALQDRCRWDRGGSAIAC